MVDTLPYLVPLLLLLPLSLYLIFFLLRKGADALKNLPPGSDGWPVLGENVEFFLSGFPRFIKHKMEKHPNNEVFRTSLMGENFVVFCGPKGNKFVFSNDEKLFTSWLPTSFRKVVLPEDGGGASLKDSVSLFRSFQKATLHPEVLRRYVPVMASLAREHLDGGGWNPNTVVEVYPLVKKYAFELSCRLFLNLTDPKSVGAFSGPFHEIFDGLLSLPVDLPGTTFKRAVRASRTVRGEILRIVKERRKEMVEKKEIDSNDLLSKLLSFSNGDGEYVSEEEISNFTVGLLLASFDSTSSSLTATIYFLARHPHVYQQVLEEQMAIAKSKASPEEELTWEDLGKMNYLKNVHNESLRLAPISAALRETLAEFNYGGFTIPKGWKVMFTPHSSHKNPDYFPEPERFDPSRFEGGRSAPNTFIPFGGGVRMCPGRNYAKHAILVFIHNLVTRFRLQEAIFDEKLLFHGFTPVPAHGLPLCLLSHQI